MIPHSEQRKLLFKEIPKNGIGAEIGVLKGRGAALILKRIRGLNL